MSHAEGPRLAVLDDGLFYRSAGALVSVAATFHRFVETVAGQGSFGRVRYIVPVLATTPSEGVGGRGVDESLLTVVPTAGFSGIADYVGRAPLMAARNWRTLDEAIARSDLLWLRLPASNAPLAMAAARRHGVPWFSWVAGSVSEVVAGQWFSPIGRLSARAIAAVYDSITELATRKGPSIRVGGDLFASVVRDEDIRATRSHARGTPDSRSARVTWVGRMVEDKGVDDLLDAVSILEREGRSMAVTLIGDGPDRPRLEARAADLRGPVHFVGYLRDEESILGILRQADVFVNSSRAEGVPKTIVEAMAAGVPVVATDVGAVRGMVGEGSRGLLVPARSATAIAQAVGQAIDEPDAALRRAADALEWAASHTREAQARRLVSWIRRRFPDLSWPSPA